LKSIPTSENKDGTGTTLEEISNKVGSISMLEYESGDDVNLSSMGQFSTAGMKRNCPRPITMMKALYWATKQGMVLGSDAELHFEELRRVLKIGRDGSRGQ